MSHPFVQRRLCAVALLSWLASGPALADNLDCAAISGGAPILYGAGGSAQRDLVGKISVVFQNSAEPLFLVYKDDAGACSGINALADLAGTKITGTAYYWDSSTGSRATCNLDINGGDVVDFAVMGNSPTLCPLITDESLVENIVDVTGPISTVNVLVPNASTQQSISAEAFYLIYGFGPDADISPWNNPDASYYIHRNENSFVQLYLAEATGLPVTKFYGVDAGTNSNSVAYLSALALPEQGIAFASGDVADANRATVRTLAWQQTGQTVGYWPDSSPTAYDKINVRRGQYWLWGPIHFYGLEGMTEGTYADENVQAVLEYFSGISEPSGATQSITETAILNKNIPTCAMEVARDGDLGDVYAWDPPLACGCYFEVNATGTTDCQSCENNSQCSDTETCSFGYCEAN